MLTGTAVQQLTYVGLRAEGLMWLISVVVCLLAAPWVQWSVRPRIDNNLGSGLIVANCGINVVSLDRETNYQKSGVLADIW